MRRLMCCMLALLAGVAQAGLLGETAKGSTDYSVEITIIDSGNGTRETGVQHDSAGIDLWYRREGAALSAITEAALAALTTAHTDGGIEHISDGVYRLDLPDAAVASGADFVSVGGEVTGMIVIGGRVKLTDVDMNDGVRAGLTALPNAAADAAGGLPISDAGGLDLDGLNTNVNDIETDTADMQPKLGTVPDLGGGATLGQNLRDLAGATFVTADDSNEAIRNRGDAAWTTGSGTGLTPIASGTAQSASATTLVLASGETFADDELIGAIVHVTGGSTGVGQTKCVTDNVGSTDTVTVNTWTTTPTGTITYEITPSIGDRCPQTSADIVDEWETQSQADPTGFHVNLLEIGGTAQTANDNGSDINAILVDTSTTLDNLVDDLETRLTAARAGYLDNLNGHTAQTGDNYARLGTPAGASIAADIATADANIDALVASRILVSGTCDSGSTTTCVDAALTQADDYWKGAAIVMTSGSTDGQTSCVYDFVAATDTLQFRPLTAAVSTDSYVLVESAVCEGVVAP